MSGRETTEGSGRRFVAEDAAVAAVAAVSLILCLRARANSVPCAFLPLALPAALTAASGAYRRRVLDLASALWSGLDGYADGGRTPWAAVAAFVVLPATLVFLSNDHAEVSGDTVPVVPTAIRLVTGGGTDLDGFYRDVSWWRKTAVGADGLPYFLARRGDHLYSSYPSGMVPFAVPVVGLSGLAGAPLSDPNVLTRLEKLTASLVAAVSLGVFFLIALHLVRPRPALAITAILTFASGLLTTVSQNLWQHDGVILGSLVVLLIEFRGPGRRGTVAQGLVCGMLPACRVTSLAFLVPFGVWVLVRSPRRAAAVAVAAALSAAPWAAYYQSVYGNPVGPSTGHLRGSLWSSDVAVPLAGVLFSPGRGLLTYQPWIVLAPLGLLPWVRRDGARRPGAGGPAGWEVVCAAAVVSLVGLVSAWNCWWGGFCWGSRLVVEGVPLCALLCARPVAALAGSAPGRAAVLALAVLGTLVQVPRVYLGAGRWDVVYAEVHRDAVWSWPRAPFLAPFNLPRR